MFHKILFPTDFSPASDLAINYAKQLAEQFSAKLHVLYVVDDPMINADSTAQSFRDGVHKRIEQQFADYKAADPTLAEAHFETRNGSAYVEIVRYAREANIDCIVLATHGRSALAHVLLGSVAENVLRLAPCPVLAIPDPNLHFKIP